MPIGFAPWAMNKMVHHLGEAATAKIAGKHNLPFIISTLTNVHPK
jgi:isopentenyl diphosphate isomerase/L-lactate dehydrogenase-like FMN-dependent dehydrogenase